MMATARELSLGSPHELKKYLDSLSLACELRFPSVTSDSGIFAANIIIYDEAAQAVLLGVYKTNLSGLPKDKVETDDSIIDTSENIFNLVRLGALKETHLEALRLKLLDPLPFIVKNTDPRVDAEYHERYHALVDRFKGNVKPYDEALSPKYGPFVWVKVSLLEIVFDKPRQVLGRPVRPHAQREAYVRFTKHLACNQKKQQKRPFFKHALRDSLKQRFFGKQNREKGNK